MPHQSRRLLRCRLADQCAPAMCLVRFNRIAEELEFEWPCGVDLPGYGVPSSWSTGGFTPIASPRTTAIRPTAEGRKRVGRTSR